MSYAISRLNSEINSDSRLCIYFLFSFVKYFFTGIARSFYYPSPECPVVCHREASLSWIKPSLRVKFGKKVSPRIRFEKDSGGLVTIGDETLNGQIGHAISGWGE